MANLHQQRCFHHAEREAVARCMECARYFCRECVTEHDDRLICAACLAKTGQVASTRQRGFPLLWRGLQFAVGVALICFFFHLAAVLLMKIPSAFHEGTLWKTKG